MDEQPQDTHRRDALDLDEALDVAYQALNQANAAARPWTNVLFVDRGAVIAVAQQNGTRAYPYTSIQRALNAIPAPSSLADELVFWHVLIANGSAPGETPKVGGRRRILLEFVSGLPDLGGLEWDDSIAGFGAPFSLLAVQGFAINGDIRFVDGGLANVSIFAADGIDNPGSKLDGGLHLAAPVVVLANDAALFKIVGATINLQEVKGGSIQSDVMCDSFARVEHCDLGDPTVPTSWTVATVNAATGFYDCQFNGPAPGAFGFTGPPTSFRVDATSNYWATAFGAPVALLGAATKLLISTGLVQTAHADNGAVNVVIPAAPGQVAICTTAPVRVESLQKVILDARAWYENPGLADTLDLAIIATPTNPAGAPFFVDGVQDQIDAANDGTTTLAGVETLLPGAPNDYTFALVANVAAGTATPTVLGGPGAPAPGPAIVPGGTLTVQVVNI